jgi:hypothetical protein
VGFSDDKMIVVDFCDNEINTLINILVVELYMKSKRETNELCVMLEYV